MGDKETYSKLIEVLGREVGKTGESEGAVEVAERLIRERDNMKTWSVALFAHVCRLTGKDPKTSTMEITKIAADWTAELRAKHFAEAGQWAEEVIDNGVSFLSAGEVRAAIERRGKGAA
jgi:hypothetical protein